MNPLSLFLRSGLTALIVVFVQVGFAQVSVSYGPELNNETNAKVTDLFGSDATSFFCHRIKTAGRNDVHIIEKYDKKTLTLIYSKPIETNEDNDLGDLAINEGTVYIFRHLFSKEKQKVTVVLETISATGVFSDKPIVLFETTAPNRECQIERKENTTKTKFLLKVIVYQGNDRIREPNFVLIDVKNKKTIWTKKVTQQLMPLYDYELLTEFKREKDGVGLTNLVFDDNDNIYFTYIKKDKETSRIKNYKTYNTTLCILEANAQTTTEILLKDNGDTGYLYSNNKGELWHVFMSEDPDAKGEYATLYLNTQKISVATKTSSAFITEPLSQDLLKKIVAFRKQDIYYFITAVFESGDNIYYVANQVRLIYSAPPKYSIITFNNLSSIVFKMKPATAKSEWVSVMNNRSGSPSVLHQEFFYCKTEKHLFLIHNDNEKNLAIVQTPNYNAKDLKLLNNIKGSNLICSSVDLNDGKVKDELVLKNTDYLFSPFKQANRYTDFSLYVPDGKTACITHTEKDGKSKFIKIKLE